MMASFLWQLQSECWAHSSSLLEGLSPLIYTVLWEMTLAGSGPPTWRGSVKKSIPGAGKNSNNEWCSLSTCGPKHSAYSHFKVNFWTAFFMTMCIPISLWILVYKVLAIFYFSISCYVYNFKTEPQISILQTTSQFSTLPQSIFRRL